MGVLLLTSGDELLLQNGVDAILLHLPEPGCLLLTLTTSGVVVSIDGPLTLLVLAAPIAKIDTSSPWAIMGVTAPTATIAMEEC